MSFAKWLSLGVAAVIATLVAVLMSLRSSAGADPTGSSYLILATAGLIGTLIGTVHWLVMSRLDREVRRLSSHVDALCRADGNESAFEPRFGLAPVSRAVVAAIARLRERIDQLTAKRRELEVQVRIAEAERRHTEAVLNSISDAVVVTDAFNEVALANETAARVLGFDIDDVRRRPIEQIIADQALIKLIKDTREGAPRSAGYRRELEHYLTHDGQDALYNVTVTGVTAVDDVAGGQGFASGHDTSGVVTVLRDITREREVAEMKRDFVSSVSHELRTPLSSIKAYMEMLVDGEAHDEQTRSDFYNIIQGETNRLSRLIDNILNISRIESGVVRAHREQMSLQALVREAVEVMRPQACAKGVELKEVSAPTFFQVFADKDMIHQATLNLISNAIKYTPSGGRIVVGIELSEAKGLVHVSVSDTGVGIPPQDLAHVFDKFYRVDRHRKMAKGTGLGLNLVKQIIETLHSGRVYVESEFGKGATFTFSLPLAENT